MGSLLALSDFTRAELLKSKWRESSTSSGNAIDSTSSLLGMSSPFYAIQVVAVTRRVGTRMPSSKELTAA